MEINKIRAAAEIAKSKTSDQRWLNFINAAVATALIVGPIHSLGQLWANNSRYIGNSRSRTGSAIDIGYFEILGEIGRMITPANYDNCWASAAGFDDVESERWQADAPKKRGDSYTPEPATLYFV
jgi:hypothetical protein